MALAAVTRGARLSDEPSPLVPAVLGGEGMCNPGELQVFPYPIPHTPLPLLPVLTFVWNLPSGLLSSYCAPPDVDKDMVWSLSVMISEHRTWGTVINRQAEKYVVRRRECLFHSIH